MHLLEHVYTYIFLLHLSLACCGLLVLPLLCLRMSQHMRISYTWDHGATKAQLSLRICGDSPEPPPSRTAQIMDEDQKLDLALLDTSARTYAISTECSSAVSYVV